MYQWSIHLILLSVICFFYYKNIRYSALAPVFIPALLVKLLSGICLGLIYLKFYKGVGDTFLYYNYAVHYSPMVIEAPDRFLQFLFSNVTGDPSLSSQPRVLTFVKFASLITFVSFNNYWIATLYFSLISFVGFFYFANKIASAVPEVKWFVAIAFLFFPSVVFWSSGFIKESIVMPALLVVAGNFFSWVVEGKRIRFGQVIITLLMSGIVFYIKFYYAAVLIPVLMSLGITKYLDNRVGLSLFKQASVFFIVLVSHCVVVSFLNPYLSINTFLQSVYQNYEATLLLSSRDKIIHFYNLIPTLTSFAVNFPQALFAGLFRPLIVEADNILMVFTGLENTLLLLLTLNAFITIKKRAGSIDWLFVTAAVVYIIVLASLLAFSSPNLGTLARYKIGFLPFFVCLLLWFSPLEKVVQKVGKPL